MQNYICLNPSEDHIQLSAEGVADGIRDRERRCERVRQIRADGPVDRSHIVAHVAIEGVWCDALNQHCTGAYGSAALIAFAEPSASLLRRDVVGYRGAGEATNCLMRDDVNR